METVVTSAEMKSFDKSTIETVGIPSAVLMERAALAVREEMIKRLLAKDDDRSLRVCIVCGVGNNGGDGLALARLLKEKGFKVFVYLLQGDHPLSEENTRQCGILKELHIPIENAVPEGEYDCVVDAIFGIGLTRAPVGIYKSAIDAMNKMRALKVAIDIPSGVNSDTGEMEGSAFKADVTVTFGFYKWGQLLYPGREYCGETVKYGIGISHAAAEMSGVKPNSHFLEKKDIKGLLPTRIPDSNKGTYGKAGIVAGSKAIGGALILSVKSAFSSGVGYVKTLTEVSNRDALLNSAPEALIYTYNDDRKVSEGSKAITEKEINDIEEGIRNLKECNCVLIGPGIGTGSLAKALFIRTLANIDCSLIVDADAINLMAKDEECKNALVSYAKECRKNGKYVVLTPHKAEFMRLSGLNIDDRNELYIEKAKSMAADLSSIIILKGASTVMFTPEGEKFVNLSGNNGMATAGSGDVLSGLLCGLFAQQSVGGLTAALAVLLHGLAGDHALKTDNEYTLTASGIINAIPYVMGNTVNVRGDVIDLII